MGVVSIHQGNDGMIMSSHQEKVVATSAAADLPADSNTDGKQLKKKDAVTDSVTKSVCYDGRAKLKIGDVNAYLTCVLCKGYYVNAATLTECLHSFCKTCIVHHLVTSKTCPICDVQVHKTKPLFNIRSDKTLQDIVYKMVPGLYKAEMKRRREFYAKHPNPDSTPSEERGDIEDRIIYSPDDKISLSLEFYTLQIAEQFHKKLFQYRDARPPVDSVPLPADKNQNFNCKRYLCCPAAVTVCHLQKFIKMKFGIGSSDNVQIIYCGEVLKEGWTLMDIAYIYTWRRNGPIRLFFQITLGGISKTFVPMIEQKYKDRVQEVQPAKPLSQKVVKATVPADKVDKTPEVVKPAVSVAPPKLIPPPPPIKPAVATPQPVKNASLLPKPIQKPAANNDTVTSTHHYKSESSKTIAELINERNMMQRRQEKTVPTSGPVDTINKTNGHQTPVNRVPISRNPVSQTSKLRNFRTTTNNIPIAPKPPALIHIYNGTKTDNNAFLNNGMDVNGIHKVVAAMGQPSMPRFKVKVVQKRKADQNEEASAPAKVMKVSSDVNNGRVPTAPNQKYGQFPPRPLLPSVTIESISKEDGATVRILETNMSDKCDQNGNLKTKDISKPIVNEVTITEMAPKAQERPEKANSENAPEVAEVADQNKTTPVQNAEERMRDSPPPDSLVIVTSSPEDSQKSPSVSPSQPGDQKKDDKSKEKSRKQKSLDEVVKNLALSSKEGGKPQDSETVTEPVKAPENNIKKTKSGRTVPFSPLDLSRKHQNLPVIPAPLPPPASMCPTSKMFPTLSSVHNKVPSPTITSAAVGKQADAMQKSLTSAATIPSATASTNGAKVPHIPITSHNSTGSKSPAKSPVSGAKKPIMPTASMAVPGSVPMPLSSYLPPHLYSRQQLDLITKYNPQLLNTAMLFSSMVNTPTRTPVPKPKKL